MDLAPHYALTPNANFQQFLSKQLANKKYDTKSKALFDEFLDTFGTHYFESGLFGGYLLQETLIDDNYRYTTSDQDIDANLNAGYLAMVKGQIDVNHAISRQSTSFQQATHTSSHYYGGRPGALLEPNFSDQQFNQWSATVLEDPWLFGGQLKPIESLITDEHLREQVKQAIFVRRSSAYLTDMKQSLTLISRSTFVSDRVNLNQQLHHIEELSAQVDQATIIPAREDIELAGLFVQKLVTDTQSLKDESYLKQYIARLEHVMKTELFCKRQLADKCYYEKRAEVTDAETEVQTILQVLEDQLTKTRNKIQNKHSDDTIDRQTLQQSIDDTRYNNKQTRLLITRANRLIEAQETTSFGECREKMICNLCKSVVIDIIERKPCDSTHIKKLLNVHM